MSLRTPDGHIGHSDSQFTDSMDPKSTVINEMDRLVAISRTVLDRTGQDGNFFRNETSPSLRQDIERLMLGLFESNDLKDLRIDFIPAVAFSRPD